MWDYKRFSQLVMRVKESGSFNGKSIGTLQEVDEEIGNLVGYSSDAVRSWRGSARKPQPLVIKQLEDIFGGATLTIDPEPQKGEKNMNNNTKIYSDFTKTQIMRCHDLLRDYVNGDQMMDEDYFCNMNNKFEGMRVAIPEEIFTPLKDFVDNVLANVVYDPPLVLTRSGDTDYNGADPQKFIMDVTLDLIDIANNFDKLAMEVIAPALLS